MKKLIALVVLLVASCGGPEPTTIEDHGPIGNPRDAVGCQRDFCPTAALEHVSLHVNGDVTECFCWCRPWDGPQPGSDYVMGFTPNPWPVDQLMWAKLQWYEFCPNTWK